MSCVTVRLFWVGAISDWDVRAVRVLEMMMKRNYQVKNQCFHYYSSTLSFEGSNTRREAGVSFKQPLNLGNSAGTCCRQEEKRWLPFRTRCESIIITDHYRS